MGRSAKVATRDGWAVAEGGGPGRAMAACLDAAIAAPSIHNSQPWRFRIDNGAVDVFADWERQVGVLDPAGRELMVSLGAAILNLRLSMLGSGRLPVLRLLPEPRERDLVARVTAGQYVEPRPTVRALHRAIPRRHTNRSPFANRPVPDTIMAELTSAAAAEGATLGVVSPVGRDAILTLVETAERIQRANWRYLDELRRWTVPRAGRRDGVPPHAIGPRDESENALPLRDFTPSRSRTLTRRASFEPHPTIVTLSTVADDPAEWLRAGQALERVLLTATVRGLSVTPMSQPTEVPEVRKLLGESNRRRSVQIVLRIGYGMPASASPRRALWEVLD